MNTSRTLVAASLSMLLISPSLARAQQPPAAPVAPPLAAPVAPPLAAPVAPPLAAPVALPPPGRAEAPPPPAVPAPAASNSPVGDKKFGIGVSTVLKNPISLATGYPSPLGITFAANPWGPITDKIFWCVDLTISTPFTNFNPTPGISVGPAFIVAGWRQGFFILEPSVGYSHTPDFTNGPPTVSNGKTVPGPTVHHSDSINVALAPGFPLKNGIIVAFPVVLNDSINSASTPVHQGALIFAFKLGVSLY